MALCPGDGSPYMAFSNHCYRASRVRLPLLRHMQECGAEAIKVLETLNELPKGACRNILTNKRAHAVGLCLMR